MTSKSKKEPHTDIPQDLIDEAMKSVESHTKEAPAKEEESSSEKPADAEHQEKFMRLAADFDNFRKRVQKEKTEFVRYAAENLVKELLPTLDNFERALVHASTAPSQDPVVEGVKMIFSQLQSTLTRFGVRAESAQGKVFDPLCHDAVSQVYSDSVPAHEVIQEHQKAYFLHDRLIRPAMVTVSKGPEPFDSELN